MKNPWRIPRIIFLTLAMFSGLTAAPAQSKLTVDMIFDKDTQALFQVPDFIWLNDGKVLLYDKRLPESQRIFELLDPATGKRMPAFDGGHVLASLKEACPEEPPSALGWPDAIDLNGSGIAYLLADDVFYIDIRNSSVRRLTQTSAPEASLAFSPDGRWLSYIRDNEIYAADLRSGLEKRLTWGATADLLNGTLSWVYWEEIYDRGDVPYAWSPDSGAIAFLQADDRRVSVSTYVDFRPDTQNVVRQRYPKAGQTNPRVRLGLVEVGSGLTRWVDCGAYEYLARFKWLPGGGRIAVQTLDRAQQTLRLFLADRATGQGREILVERQPAWINLNDALYFLADGKRFLWMSERDGFQHVYLYGIDGTLERQVSKGEFMVQGGGFAGVDDKAGWLYYTSNEAGLKERQLYKTPLKGKAAGPGRLISRGEGVHAVSFSPDLRYYFDTWSNAATPPELALYRADGTKTLVVAESAKPWIAERNVRTAEFKTFKAEDGLELPVMEWKPAAFDPQKKYPAIVYVYGEPGAQQVVDTWGRRNLWNSLLAENGFFVYTFEVRAGMGKNKALETSVYKRAYGMRNVKDIEAGLAWLKTMPAIDGSRIGIWGGSGGGCTTLYAMTHSDAFKAGISLYPVSDWRYYDTIYTERYQSTPQENPEGYEETSAVKAAGNLKGRLLIVHGTYDDNVHPQNTEAFSNELIARNIPFEMMIYPWRKHGLGDTPAIKHLYTMMLEFWKKNL